MAPPEKDVMGVRMKVATDPPEDDPPLQPPRPRAKQSSKPTIPVEVDWPEESPTSAQTPQSRKLSPPGGIKLEGKWGKITIPQMALVAILASFGGAGVGAKVVAGGAAETSTEVLEEVKLLRRELGELKADVRAVRSEQLDARGADRKLAAYVSDSVAPVVASLRRLGVKLEYDGKDQAADVDFHAPPGPGSTAPPIQPKAVLPAKPNL